MSTSSISRKLGGIMVNSPIISSERLDLIPLTPAFLQASLQGDSMMAASLLGLSIPAEWFQEQSLVGLRLVQLQQTPALQPWLLRAIGLRHQQVMVGHIGFHTAPDAEYLRELVPGGVEYGYTVFAAFRRQEYAREACTALMEWAYQEHQVTRFVVSIRPDNIPSRRLAEEFGFKRIGSHIDEEDGLEDIYEVHYGN
jgi:RimJ/RimL family protein N-acetyltransferase